MDSYINKLFSDDLVRCVSKLGYPNQSRHLFPMWKQVVSGYIWLPSPCIKRSRKRSAEEEFDPKRHFSKLKKATLHFTLPLGHKSPGFLTEMERMLSLSVRSG